MSVVSRCEDGSRKLKMLFVGLVAVVMILLNAWTAPYFILKVLSSCCSRQLQRTPTKHHELSYCFASMLR